jgi:hypothetical protein
MKVKFFDTTTGVEFGDVILAFQDEGTFDASAHSGSNSVAAISEEDALEILVDGDTHILDITNKPTILDNQTANISGYEPKTGGGYQATWAIETLMTPEAEAAPAE